MEPTKSAANVHLRILDIMHLLQGAVLAIVGQVQQPTNL